ncbi:hypothetical protein BDR06DRAFT_1050357 [Suillus hirtellus]|nr:hypothetical protein BDR06DRAFT_1050357 [Suillus hirtellus]
MAPGPNLKSSLGFEASQNQFGRVRTPPKPPSVSTYTTSISLLLQVPDSYWLIFLSQDIFLCNQCVIALFNCPTLKPTNLVLILAILAMRMHHHVWQLFIRPLLKASPPVMLAHKLDKFVEEVFGNILDPRECNRRLVEAMIGDMFLDAAREFHFAYPTYKYPITLEAIMKETTEGNPDMYYLAEAIEAIRNLQNVAQLWTFQTAMGKGPTGKWEWHNIVAKDV